MAGSLRQLRGAGFPPILDAQRAYLQQSAKRPRLGLLVPEAFVRGIRYLGYRSNGDAVAELIDNAIQACANRIDVLFGYERTASAKKPSQLAVVDNGHGMEPEMIRMAVMWGGTHRENDRSGLGRYGYGLPCSSVSLGRRFTVFSKVVGGLLHAVTLDLDEIVQGSYTDRQGSMVVPSPQVATLPIFVSDHVRSAYGDDWTSGTVVLVDKIDRLTWTTAHALKENLSRQLGVTYHKLSRDAALYVDSTLVEPCDPLFLTPGFRLHDIDDDRAYCLDPVCIEVRHPVSDAHLGTICLRYAWLPPSFASIDKSREAVGMNANARLGTMKDYHGIIFSRNGRLIDVQARTPWTTFINNDRYIKVEIEFSATLDEWFGVTTSKQQVTVSPFIWDLLKGAGLPKAIEQLRAKVKKAKLQRRAGNPNLDRQGARLSERAVPATAKLPPDFPIQRDIGFSLASYRLTFQSDPCAPFFRVDLSQGTYILNLNKDHVFYKNIYNGEISDGARRYIELFLLCVSEILVESQTSKRDKQISTLNALSQKITDTLDSCTSSASHPER